MIFADREASFIFRRFVMVVNSVPKHNRVGQWLEIQGGPLTSLLAGTSHEPLQHGVQICLLLCAYAIATHFAMGDGL